MSSTDAGSSPPYMVNIVKSPLVKSAFSPHNKFVASRGSCTHVPEQDCGFLNVGSHLQMRKMAVGWMGEDLPELPEGGLPHATTRRRNDLQLEISPSPPVENEIGIQVDTTQEHMAQADRIEIKGHKRKEISNPQKVKDATQRVTFKNNKEIQVLGYVPIQIANLSLEEIELSKHRYIGVASPTQITDIDDYRENTVNSVERTHKETKDEFEDYFREKLGHLDAKDCYILETVLQRYKHLFYGLGSIELVCSSQVEHSIETGDARPIKRTPYRIPCALKPVVEEHIDDMLKRNIIEPSMSPWSSSIVLVQKKSKDGSIKYRFFIDYRSLNAVTKPDAYPIPNIVDTLDSVGRSRIFTVLDMASGYHQIPTKSDHKEKTAFSCHRGHFQFIKMPFGLNNAPATYQRCIDVVLMGLKGIDCLVYLDDIICFSVTMEEHAKKLGNIFDRLE